ncbi:hypothetical protein [Streptomyces sp. Qhu_M48]|uniref:hypothetical protein n=1 Tax=Streptomyces sp. Qhu_M48 TaxID=3435889 RepID=UPI003F50BCD6
MRFGLHHLGRVLAVVALTVGALAVTTAGRAADAPPAPAGVSSHHAGSPGGGGSLAGAGGHGERLWLLGALGLALAATGLVARAAMRGRREN